MLRNINDKEFDLFYNIMEQSFPPDEYRPYNEQRALLDNQNYRIYVMPDDNESIKAFVTVWSFDDFAFVEHFAVNPEYRNKGLGSIILQELSALINGLICLEVEPPETELSIRRIVFYKRNGFYLNEYPYIQPPISVGRKPIPLFIMTYGREVDEEEFEKMKTIIYKEVYKQNKGAYYDKL